jgi:hypothetical protein
LPLVESKGVSNLKNWQRVIACLAVQEVFEMEKADNESKFEYCESTFKHHALIIYNGYKEQMPRSFSATTLLQNSLDNCNAVTNQNSRNAKTSQDLNNRNERPNN